ncbi:PolC-type DNA polymerase III [Faecalibacterium hattorii]|uniref:3'-5' exonuclease n=1 Tax=Faecalibacterium hattorii TaxID=2935520 RepID=UPI003AAA5205
MEYLTEIGGVIVKNGEVVEESDTFVKPGKPITPKIPELTGITDEMVADAPGEAEALQAFLNFAAGRILVAHNATSISASSGSRPSGAASSSSQRIFHT